MIKVEKNGGLPIFADGILAFYREPDIDRVIPTETCV